MARKVPTEEFLRRALRHLLPTGYRRAAPSNSGALKTGAPLNRIEGRFQRLETDPLPCTKSVLQSHSADVATANNFR